MAGLTEYRNQRQQEVAGKQTSQDGRPFHDGRNTLTTVEQMHERFLIEEGEVRPGDHVTKHVLRDMVCSMLSDDPDGRDNAIVLWKKSQKCLEKGQKQTKKFGQRQSSPIENHVVRNEQIFDQRAPEKSSEVPYRAAEQFNRPSHVHGPPPFDPQYSANHQSNGQSYLLQQPLKKRSETWNDPSSTRGMVSGPHNAGLSSPHQFARAGSTLDNYAVPREQLKTRAMISEEATDGAQGNMWQGAHCLESEPVPQHDPGASAPPGSRTSPKSYTSRQMRSGAGLEPIYPQEIQDRSPFGPPPNSDAQFSNTGSIPKGPVLSQSMSENVLSEETIRRSPPHSSTLPPPGSKPNQNRPSLSFAQAKKIREKRAFLPDDAAQLLRKLKDRDHVRYYPASRFSPLMQFVSRCS